MMSRFTILTSIFILLSCHPAKKAVTSEPVPPVAQVPEPAAEAEIVTEPPYRPSVTRTNDIIHTKLEVNFDWQKSRMNGKATIQVKPYFYPVDVLYLDARGMEIKNVEVYEVASVKEKKKVAGKTVDEKVDIWNRVTASTFVYSNDSLKISLGRSFTAEESYFVTVDYVARPNELKSTGKGNAITDDRGLYFINPTGENPFKMPQIWTQGETQSSSVWFPTIDSPNEKMTQEILMTVDDKYITLSNGSLVSSIKNGTTRTDHWKLEQPHSPYLAMMAVGEFKKVTGPTWNGKEVSYYVEKEYEPHAEAMFGDTREMIEFYSGKLGVPYAWPKYSQIVVRDYVSGAMENTSATLHGDFIIYQTTRETIDEKKGEAVIAHELFHQWFGDLVTCESWSNLSLNESFATYGEYLWEEYKHGRDAADYHHWQSRQSYFHSDKEKKIIRYHYEEKDDMFDAFSYSKGGQVLHMLRKAVGDEAFFASLRNYLQTNRYKSAEIHHLRLAFEETTGQDLNWFFNQWFLSEGRPKLKITKKYNSTTQELELQVEQLQDIKKYPLYRLPVEVDIYTSGATTQRVPVLITEQKQQFIFKNIADPLLVNFDAERQLLADVEYTKSVSEYVFQYQHAPLYQDRFEALNGLEPEIARPEIFSLFTAAAKKDGFYALRNYAITQLTKAPEEKSAAVKTTLIEIYNADQKTVTRARALSTLNKKFTGDNELKALNESALKEKSYAICATALQYFSDTHPDVVLEKAMAFKDENGKDVLFTLANIFASHGGDEQMSFFHNSLGYFGGFEVIGFAGFYARLAKKCSDPQNALMAAKDLEIIAKGAIKYVKYPALKGIKDILSVWELKEKAAEARLDTAKKENKDVAAAEKELKAALSARESLSEIYNRAKL